MILNISPIAPMLLAFLIPMIYCLKWRNESLKKVLLIFICCILIVLLYPITTILNNYIESSLGYFLGKLVLFTVLPLIILAYLKNWKIRDTFTEVGLQKRNLGKSIILGFIVLIITIIITLICCWGTKVNISLPWNIVMFFDAFNEEFLFRGVLLLYMYKITNIRVAYATSILAFVLAHPQHFSSLFLISTIIQGVMLAIITYKTKNIVGPWISHGLNRVIPYVLRALFF